MSVNRYQPHVLVLPEDDANRQLANGFHLQIDQIRRMQVLPVAGGWNEVLDHFQVEHVPEMLRWPNRLMILLIDCDGDQNRLNYARTIIPPGLAARVFILGVLTEPEALKAELGGYERIGSRIATDCRYGTNQIWRQPLLQHNAEEIDRLREQVRPILFEQN